MPVEFSEIKIASSAAMQLIDITSQVKEKVQKSNINNGAVIIYSPHATASVKVSEYEKGPEKDFLHYFKEIAPSDKNYVHNTTTPDGKQNTHSHLVNMLINQSETIPIRGKSLVLGKWQTIFFIKLDGPRPERKAIIEIIGD